MVHRRFAVLLMVLGLTAGIFAARLPGTMLRFSGEPDWDAAVAEVAQIVAERHVDQREPDALYLAAIHGLVDSLDDPYSEFVPPDAREDFEKELTGEFGGIGATIAQRDGWPVIVTPIAGSPAAAAGLLPGDRVVAVDGVSLKGKSLDDGIKLVGGEPGTNVKLSVQRGPAGAPPAELELTITRAHISAPAVFGFRWDQDRQAYTHLMDPARAVAYLRLEQFTPSIARELREAIKAASGEAGGRPLRGIVLDLRDNPGGLLDQAVDIAGMFLKDGVIVTTRWRDGQEDIVRVEGSPILPDVPITILVNENSASASEILAGGLQDRQRAVVVGTRSFGKGLVQIVEELESVPGAQLKLTEQRFYLPSGRLIQRMPDSTTWGVDPSPGFYVPLNVPQRQAFLERREAYTAVWPKGTAHPAGAAEPDWSDPASITDKASDPQLAAALRAVQARIDSGDWKPTGLALPADQPASIAADERAVLQRRRQALLRELGIVERQLVAQADAKAHARPTDLWPDSVDLTGGSLEVLDAQGHRVQRLRITGPELEAWLLEADVEPAPAPAPTPQDAQGQRP